MNWIHRLFNPHCPVCIEEDRIRLEQDNAREEYDNTCKACESLRSENNFLRGQIQNLLDHILNPPTIQEPTIDTDNLKPIQPLRKPFSVIRNELERADKIKAKEIDERLKQTAAKSDVSSITNDEGKVDINKVQAELDNIDKEIANG